MFVSLIKFNKFAKALSCIVLLLLTCSTSSGVRIIPANESEYMTCYDYSVSFATENPDWEIVTISNNRLFKGASHMVNCQVVDEDTIRIHDGMYNIDCI